jgi:N-acylneuraminate cytidylyltransferase
VLLEVLNYYKSENIFFDNLCCIYPTAPFVTSHKLLRSLNILTESNADCVLPVVQYSYPIQRSLKIDNGKISMNWPENYLKRSQDFEPIYHDCGQYYFMKVLSFYEQKKLFMFNSIPIVTSELEVQDIDNEEDWKIAELKFSLLNK